jgi:hypothetical protein
LRTARLPRRAKIRLWLDRFQGVNDGLRASRLSIKAVKRVEGRKQDEAFCNSDERRRLGGLFACVGSSGGSDRQAEKLGEP